MNTHQTGDVIFSGGPDHVAGIAAYQGITFLAMSTRYYTYVLRYRTSGTFWGIALPWGSDTIGLFPDFRKLTVMTNGREPLVVPLPAFDQ